MRKAILCLLFLSVLCLSAQTVYKLDSCKAMAKENNLALQNKKLEIERARQTQKEVFTKYFPTVSAIGVGFKMSDYMVDMDYGLGTVKLPFFNYILPSIQLPSIPMQMLDGGLMGGVTAVQPVFAGLRIVRGNQLAKLGVQAAELQAQMSENEVDAMVENYYWQIVALQEKLRTIETLDKQLARVSEDVDAAVGAGVVNRNSQLQVQLKRQELLSGKVDFEDESFISEISAILSEGENSKESIREVSRISKSKLDSYDLENYRLVETNVLNNVVLTSKGDWDNAENISVATRTYGEYSFTLSTW